MRVVLQRVSRAQVSINGRITGKINAGFMALVGFAENDTEVDVEYLVEKCINLRVFSDADGKMNLSIKDNGGAFLSISQFTLYADTRKGRRPSFIHAAPPEKGEQLYHYFNLLLRNAGFTVETGIFGAMMDVELVNNGPVTIVLDSIDRQRSRRDKEIDNC